MEYLNPLACYEYATGVLEIPETITHNDTRYTVISLGEYAFHYCKDLISVTLPNTITSINDRAFWFSGILYLTIPNSVTEIGDAFASCFSLQDIILPSSITSIGKYMLYGCVSLTNIAIPNSVTSIGEQAFYNCWSLTNISIPNSVTSIGEQAFYNCLNLTNITISNSVTSIGEGAFSGCQNLTNINVDSENEHYSSESGVLYSKDGTTLIQYPNGKPEESFSIPSSVMNITSLAFSGDSTKIKTITVPASVTNIEFQAFGLCNSLVNINVDNNNLYYSSDNGILYSKDRTTLIQYPNGKLEESFSIPDFVTTIATDAFYDSKLKNVILPNSMTAVSPHAFDRAWSLTNVTIPNSVITIETSAFNQCTELRDIVIPNSVIEIGDHAFSMCYELTDVLIPNSVTKIDRHAFSWCTKMTNITIPSSVSYIGEFAFVRSNHIKSIYCQWTTPVEGENLFSEEIFDEAILYIPSGCKSEYEKVSPWLNFKNIEEMAFSEVDKIKEPEINVEVVNGAIFIKGGQEVAIYSITGKCVYFGDDQEIDNLPSGVYVVTSGSKSVKVVIP
ncbi:MAG: leucine-rich repeat protein [Bacteroides sp.]|nr:leucine-rich repeat protein [Bacteroides sp.]